MKKTKPMTSSAAKRIVKATVKKTGGNIPKKSFASRATSTVAKTKKK